MNPETSIDQVYKLGFIRRIWGILILDVRIEIGDGDNVLVGLGSCCHGLIASETSLDYDCMI